MRLCRIVLAGALAICIDGAAAEGVSAEVSRVHEDAIVLATSPRFQ